MRMRKQASIFRVVLGVGLRDFWDILATYSFYEGVSMRGEHGREGSGCDDDTINSALAGRLKGRRSSAVTAEVAVATATCCVNSHRLFGSPTQLQLRLFTYTKTTGKSHMYYVKKVPAKYCAWPVTCRSAYFSRRSGNTSTKNKKTHSYSILRVPTTQLAKMSTDLKFVKLTADVLED